MVATPRAARWLAWCSVLLAVTFVVFLLTARYPQGPRARGAGLRQRPVLVAATEAGTLVSVDVRAGDSVKAGQRLATISTERTAGGEAVFAAGERDAQARRSAIAGERRQAQALLAASKPNSVRGSTP